MKSMKEKKGEEKKSLNSSIYGHGAYRDLKGDCVSEEACFCEDSCDCGDDNCDCSPDFFTEYEKYLDEHYPDRHRRGFKYWCGYFSSDNFIQSFFGFLVLIFGVLYLGRNLGWWNFNINWAVFWPIFLIVAGLGIIKKARSWR